MLIYDYFLGVIMYIYNEFNFVKDDIEKIDKAIEKCDKKLEYYKNNGNLFLDENYQTIKVLEMNRKLLDIKKSIIEKDYMDGKNRLLAFYDDWYETEAYGYIYTYLIREKKYVDNYKIWFFEQIYLMIHHYYHEFKERKLLEIYEADTYLDDFDSIKDENLKNKLLKTFETENMILSLTLDVILLEETIYDMVDDIFDLNIDNLNEYVYDKRIFEVMSNNNIIDNSEKYEDEEEAVSMTIYNRYKEKKERISTWDCYDFSRRSKFEKIIELFTDTEIDHIYDSDTIDELSVVVDFINKDNEITTKPKKKSYR